MIVDGNINGELLYPYSLITPLFFKTLLSEIVEIVKFIPILLVIPLCLPDSIYLPSVADCGLLFLFSSLLGMFIILLLDLGFSLTAFSRQILGGILILRNGLFHSLQERFCHKFFIQKILQTFLKLLPYSFAG